MGNTAKTVKAKKVDSANSNILDVWPFGALVSFSAINVIDSTR